MDYETQSSIRSAPFAAIAPATPDLPRRGVDEQRLPLAGAAARDCNRGVSRKCHQPASLGARRKRPSAVAARTTLPLGRAQALGPRRGGSGLSIVI